MLIRPYRADDAPVLAALYHAAVHGVGALHYTPDQVAAWSPAPPDSHALGARLGDGRLCLVADGEDGQPVAFGDLEADGHIDLLYCRPDHAGTGVTASLYAELERHARAGRMTSLFVEASEPARRFFLRQGFGVIERRDFPVNGVMIHNFRMEKRLG